MKNTQRIVNLGHILPGAGHLASGRVAAAWFRLSMVAWGFFLITAGWMFDSGAPWKSPGLLIPSETFHSLWLPLPQDMWTGWLSLPFLFGASLLVLGWLIALFDGSNLRQGMPEHFSWAPNSTRVPGYGNESKNTVDDNSPGVAVGPGLRNS